MRYVIFVLLLILTSTSTYTQVIISEVDPNRPSVVFKNVSDQPVYLGDFGFRSGFFDFGTIDRTLQPDESVSFLWILNDSYTYNFGEYSIYRANQYNAANFIDYVVWSDRDTITGL